MKAIVVSLVFVSFLLQWNASYSSEVRETKVDDHQIVIYGEQHDSEESSLLRQHLIQQAFGGEIILFLEGVNRDEDFELSYRLGWGGQGSEPVFGLDESPSTLVNLSIMCRYQALGAVEGYDVSCPETLVNQSVMSALGQRVWKEVAAELGGFPLVQAIQRIVDAVNTESDAKLRLDKYDEMIATHPLPNDPQQWDKVYRAYGLAAMAYVQNLPEGLHYIQDLSLEEDADTKPFVVWFYRNTKYRDILYARTIVNKLPDLDPEIPIVVVVGSKHVDGLLYYLQNAQLSPAGIN